MFDLSGRRALVTGSSQGIGKAIAKALAGQGAEVYVHASSSMEKAKAAAEEIGGGCHPVVADLADRSCAERLYAQTGEVDLLILNASVQFRTPWKEIGDQEADRQIQVNFLATLRLIQAYVPAMEQRGFGRIVTVGSVQQYRPHKDMLVYAATKDAQMSLVRNLAKQLAPVGITVNNLSPGVIVTRRNEEALADEGYRDVVTAGIPCGFLGEPEDCAPCVVMLCAENARYITGINIPVDGGMRL